MKPQQELQQEPQQNLQQRIGQQRVQHIIDSYLLKGNEPEAFDTYLHHLLGQYPDGLVELALVETIVRNWLTIPMQKGIPFLTIAHDQIKQWQQGVQNISLTHSQFQQITGLDPETAFTPLEQIQQQLIPTATKDGLS